MIDGDRLVCGEHDSELFSAKMEWSDRIMLAVNAVQERQRVRCLGPGAAYAFVDLVDLAVRVSVALSLPFEWMEAEVSGGCVFRLSNIWRGTRQRATRIVLRDGAVFVERTYARINFGSGLNESLQPGPFVRIYRAGDIDGLLHELRHQYGFTNRGGYACRMFESLAISEHAGQSMRGA